MKALAKYSFGLGDRFSRQGEAQLRALIRARDAGLPPISPVWNKSHREHLLTGTQPDSVRAEADAAVASLGWEGSYHVDADHIGLGNVDAFLNGSDFYTLDVAEFIGKPAKEDDIERFVSEMDRYSGTLTVPGVAQPFVLNDAIVRAAAGRFLLAVQQAGGIYRHIESKKGRDNFITEVSVDESQNPQTPVELFLILAMLAREGIPAQTVAPRFGGRFNKGVDYVGDLAQFEREFDKDLCVVAFAAREFGLPANLKLSVHSGSDKFSLYPIINRLVKKHDAGLHVKTAGTTWLEELIGLAGADGEGLRLAREIYLGAHRRFAELTAPYTALLDIDKTKLPAPERVGGWGAADFVAALRHDPACPAYNPHFRQLLHVGFKVAAEMKGRYTDALAANSAIIGQGVTGNLYARHLVPLFG